MIYEAGDVVVVPFPFTDKAVSKRRPALVISSNQNFGEKSRQSVCAMITTAKQSTWPLDTPIDNLDAAGLTAQSVVRFKLFTLDNRLVVRRAGRLATDDWSKVTASLAKLIDF